MNPSSSSSRLSLPTSLTLPLSPLLLRHLTSKLSPQLHQFLQNAAYTAQEPQSPVYATQDIAYTTAPNTAAHRQLKPEPAITTPPKTPQKPAASNPKSSPTDTSTIITESTPVDQTDPLPDSKRTFYFLSQRTREQQTESIQSNPHYLTSLNEWIDSLDSEELTSNQQKLLPYLPLLKELLQEGLTHYQSLALRVSQLQATVNQLKEDNNRLSTLPHKDSAFSHLQEDHQKLVETFNELNQEYTQIRLEALELRAKAKERDNLQKELQRLLTLFPNIQETHQLEKQIEELRNTERNSNNLAAALAASLEDWENVGRLLAPHSSHPFEAATKATQLLETNNKLKEQLNILRSHHRRLSDTITQARSPPRMADTTHATGMIQGDTFSPGNIRTLWEQIPEQYRQLPEGTSAPQTMVELITALGQLTCQHPREIAEDLTTGNPDLHPDSWEESRSLVRGLASQPPPGQNVLFPNPFQASRLFKITDVPKFTNAREYDSFRSKLIRFLRTVEPPNPNEFNRALEIVLSSFEDEAIAKATQSWDVSRLIYPTWKETYTSFMEALDKKFLSSDYLEQVEKQWNKTWPRKDETMAEFFNRFDGITNQYAEAVKRSGVPPLTMEATVGQLVRVLPMYITDFIRLQLKMTGKGNIKNLSVDELRDQAEYASTYLPKPAVKEHATSTRYETGKARPTPANPGRNEVRTMNCGLVCSYDTSPPVPAEARGSIYPDQKNPANNAANEARRLYCAQHGLCRNCRRTASQHNTVSATFNPVPKQIMARPAPVSKASTPMPGQLQIEAAPLLDL